jgi:hypothetical protein
VREREGWGGGGEYRQKQGREIRAPNERLAGKAAWGASCALYYPNYIYYIYIYIYTSYMTACILDSTTQGSSPAACTMGEEDCVCVCVWGTRRERRAL